MPGLPALRCFGLLLLLLAAARGASAGRIDFNRDIRPILSENCFHCHGQDAARRKAKLRLDDRESAVRDRDGRAALVPGKPEESEVILRLIATDPDEKMPPADSHRTVTPAQIALIRQWIAEGAEYEKHWAFVPPTKPNVPGVPAANARNAQPGLKSRAQPATARPMDAFVRARLEREGLSPSPEAAPEAWLRRASLDLVGLPPTPAELDRFAAEVASRGELAYEAAVDRLLASPHFGERQAIEWLDVARYADTHGFNNDSARTMWRWRDWVIDAFNANLPYDRFITEQLAGDLLPQPTLEQRIATGFGRNHVINSEGGIIDEEYRVEYVADRVRTMSTAWLGLTFECARCHDHKYDPVSQRDYYRLFAFFNNVPEHGEDGRVANAVPMIPAPTREQQAVLAEQARALAEFDNELDRVRRRWRWSDDMKPRVESLITAAGGEREKVPGVPLLQDASAPEGIAGAAWRAQPDQPAPKVPAAKLDFAGKEGFSMALWLRPDSDNPRDVALVSSLNHRGSADDAQYGKGHELRLIDGEVELRMSSRLPVYAAIVRTEGAAIRPEEWRHVAMTYAGGKSAAAVRIFVDGIEIATRVRYDGLQADPGKREFLVGADNAHDGARWRGVFDDLRSFPRALDAAAIRARFHAAALPYALRLAAGEESRGGSRHEAGSEADALRGRVTPVAAAPVRYSDWLREALLADEASTRELVAQRTAAWENHLALRRSLPTAMVMEETLQPRPAFVLQRGQYDAPGERVEAGVPEEWLASWPAGAPRNRLGLAQWLTHPQHPLTARVVVNRWWAQLFGTGLVKTLEDFGSQGEWPSHPELLDWLAREFVDGGWNVKALLKTIVLSATYRQSSAVTPELAARDPENRLLARGPRLRLPAESIRDQALAVAGLLVPRIGGPSVYPYQPDKLYEGVVVGADYPGTKWTPSTGEDLYRRSLYTFWKRTVPHPAMVAFDAPDREVCTVRRSRTNTPLQALVLWNEPSQLEAARKLGERMLREGGADARARMAWAFRLATGRRPAAEETRVLSATFDRLRAEFANRPDDALKLLQVGAAPPDADLPAAERAAAMSVASMILSLDETITKN